MHAVVEEIYRYYNYYFDTQDEAQNLLPNMMITENVLVIIYYCADVAWAERHNKTLQIHTTSS